MTLGHYQVGGSLSAEHSIYIERQADHELLSQLERGELCYVFNSRQMGKSSLLLNAKTKLQKKGYLCSFVDISRIGNTGSTVEQWFGGLLSELWRGFGLPSGKPMLQWWSALGNIPPAQKLAIFLSEKLLSDFPDRQLAIFFDEVDSVLSLPFPPDDFFSVIRACYNQRADDQDLKRLRFAFFGVTLPKDLVSDPTRSPFNIGKAIRLEGFSVDEAFALTSGLNLTDKAIAERLLARVFYWTGGQPFLSQKVFRLLSEEDLAALQDNVEQAVDELVYRRIIDNWESHDNPEHLKTIRDRALLDSVNSTHVLAQYQQLLEAKSEQLDTQALPDTSRLYLTGLIAINGTQVTPRTRIYRTIFDWAWANQNLENQRPYWQKFASWQASNQRDTRFLLQGEELAEAKTWAQSRHIPEQDHRFIVESQTLENQQVQEWNSRLEHEISERKKTELDLQKALSQLAHAKTEAEQANAAKSDFLARVSREVRTPINSILGLSYIAKQQLNDERNIELVRNINHAAKYMSGVINDIVDISKVERGELSLNHETFYLDDVLDQLFSVIGLSAYEKGISLVLVQPDEMLPALFGDKVRLEQTLLNLMSNAVRHSDSGTITLRVQATQETECEVMTLKFEVIDTGRGVGKSPLNGEVSRNPDSILKPGIGLGLSCELIGLMGGALNVSSAPGEGSTFHFEVGLDIAFIEFQLKSNVCNIIVLKPHRQPRLCEQLTQLGHVVKEYDIDEIPVDALKSCHLLLIDDLSLNAQARILSLLDSYPLINLLPLIPRGARSPHWLQVLGVDTLLRYPYSIRRLQDTIVNSQLPPQLPGISKDYVGEQKRALVTDDDEINQQIVAELLKGYGFTVDIAGNGQEAIDRVNTKFYDLILMDIEMPLVGGIEAVKTIRQLGSENAELSHLSRTPIIAMTAHALIDDTKTFIAAGMNDHISKPLDPSVFARVIGEWLSVDKKMSPEESVGAAELEIPSVDTRAGLLRCGGNAKLYLDVLLRFSELYHRGVDVNSVFHDAIACRELCHKIKGSAGNLGAHSISRKASAIEVSCRAGEQPEKQALSELSQDLMALSQDIRCVSDLKIAPEKPLNRGSLVCQLERLLSALDTDHGEAAEITSELPAEFDGQLQGLKAAMDTFDIDKALRLTRDWIDKLQADESA